jgi:endonuclease III
VAKESLDAKSKRTRTIIGLLEKLYPDATCALLHANAFELLVATILSAQCTDARVNIVTPVLFKKCPTPAALARASQDDIEAIIQSTGFFRNKAKSLREASADIVEKYGGKVPATMEELTTLRGVGRKTANVVLGNAFDRNVGVVVDTHVGRLSLRLGLTTQTNPEKVEQDLMVLVPQEKWTEFSHLLIYHGRKICNARAPQCSQCALLQHCPEGRKRNAG